MKTLMMALFAATLSVTAAYAASTTTPTGGQGQQSNPAAAQPSAAQGQQSNQTSMQPNKVTEAMRSDLSSAGFTDIKIMPESFLIRAKDKNGNPVMMIVNPDSMTEIRATDTNQSNDNSGAPPSNNSEQK